MYQYEFSDPDKCTTSRKDVNKRENVCVWGGGVQKLSVLYLQEFCKSNYSKTKQKFIEEKPREASRCTPTVFVMNK